jgi:cell division protein FtsL
VDGVVSHCQGNGSVRLMLDMCLCVCGLCVVVLGLPDKLLATRLDSVREEKKNLSNTVKNNLIYAHNPLCSHP